MKKNKGFTLIELLAVIVILAIIALIAVPVVMNIIGKANKSAFKDSAYGLLKAGETFYTSELLKEAQGITEDKVFTFPDDIDGLEFKGSKPTKGTMTVRKDGKVSMAISNGKYCVTKGFEDEDVIITDDVTNCKISADKTLTDLAVDYDFNNDGTNDVTKNDCMNNKTEGACTPGTAFAIKVNEAQTHKFYVLKDNGNEVTLIMDRNIGEEVAWYKDGDDTTNNETSSLGPITALNYLNDQTKDWNNIPEIQNYIYDNNLNGTTNNNGYQKLQIENGLAKLTSQDGEIITQITGKSRARLLTEEEFDLLCVGDSCYEVSWLADNMTWDEVCEEFCGEQCYDDECYEECEDDCDDFTVGHYWFLTGNYYKSAIRVELFEEDPVSRVTDLSILSGIRPVITLSK